MSAQLAHPVVGDHHSDTARDGTAVPFSRLSLAGNEQFHLARSIESGHLAGDGEYSHRCRALLEHELGVPAALLTTSCTHALEMAALLLDIRPGDEVIVPSFTFVSTANAFVLRGARPVFVDIRPDTLNLDEAHLEAKLSSRVRAIVVVHYAGLACEMDAILEIAGRWGIPVVEDNAHGLFGTYRGRRLGAFGELAVLSFHETKNFTCGEGGALLVNNPDHISRAEILREKGTNRTRFLRGNVDKYTWVDLGSSYLMSDLLAAFLYGQLQARDRIQRRRKQIWDIYQQALGDWAQEHAVGLPEVPRHCDPAYHLFYMVMPSQEHRRDLIEHLRRRQIQATFHYPPLHLSDMGRRFGGREGDCPVTEDVSSRLVRLPFHNSLTHRQQMTVVEACLAFKLQAEHAGAA